MPNQPENGRSSSRREREVSRNIKRERDGGDVGGDARDDRGTARDDRGSARGGEGQEGYGKDGKRDGDTVRVVRRRSPGREDNPKLDARSHGFRNAPTHNNFPKREVYNDAMNDSGYSAGFASHPESHRGSRGWYEGGVYSWHG